MSESPSENETEGMLMVSVTEPQTESTQTEKQESFILQYDGQDTGMEIFLSDCVCEYDADDIQVYSRYIQNGFEEGISLPYFRYVLFIQTPWDTAQIYPVYSDTADMTEFLFLGKNGKLIYYDQFYGRYTWNGYTECVLDAEWKKERIRSLEIYDLGDFDSYDEEELAWIKENMPENMNQEGCYFYKERPKTEEEIEQDCDEEFWTEETLTKEQFLKEFEDMTGMDFRKDNPDWEL